MKKLTFSIIVALFIISGCTKEPVNNNKEIKEKIARNRAFIKEKIKLHSGGLSYFITSLSATNPKTKNGPVVGPSDPGIPVTVTPEYIRENVYAFLALNNIPQDKQLAVLSPTFIEPSVSVISLADHGFQFSTNFYVLALQITSVVGDNIVEINSALDNIINSNDFVNLTEVEQNILLASAETAIDSFNYWGSQTDWTIWEATSNNKILTKRDDTQKRRMYLTQADAKGAIAGGIGGAVVGGIAGFFAGGPAGAAAGAANGYIYGAIGGGITNSIQAYLDKHYPSGSVIAVPDVVVMQNGLLIPEIWTKAAFDSNAEIPVDIEFENGKIIPLN